MPESLIKSLAKQSGRSMDTVEQYWNRAKVIAAKNGHKDDYDYITGITKRMAGIAEKFDYKPFFNLDSRK